MEVWLLTGERNVCPLPKHFRRKKTVIVKKIIAVGKGHRVCYEKSRTMVQFVP